jgi:hypothetical protein
MASDPRRAPRIPFDPALGWALVGVVAVAIVIGAALILTSPEPVNAPARSTSANRKVRWRSGAAGSMIGTG